MRLSYLNSKKKSLTSFDENCLKKLYFSFEKLTLVLFRKISILVHFSLALFTVC